MGSMSNLYEYFLVAGIKSYIFWSGNPLLTLVQGWLLQVAKIIWFSNQLLNFDRRLEDAISQRESEKRKALDKWQEVTDRISVINVDARTKLRLIKEKDPHTAPEIQEQLEALQVKIVVAQ